MGRPPDCNCHCGPPDCFGCNPEWITNPQLSLKAHLDWDGPTWGMPGYAGGTISGINLHTVSGGALLWNCGSWSTPPMSGCGTVVVSGELHWRWWGLDPALLSGPQLLCRSFASQPCRWSRLYGMSVVQWQHGGYLGRSSFGGPVVSGPPEWAHERVDHVVPPYYSDECTSQAYDGTDTNAATYSTAVVRHLYTLSTSRPSENGLLGWSRGRVSATSGFTLDPIIHTDSTYRWRLTVALNGIRTWMFVGLRQTGVYAGHYAGPTFGSSSAFQTEGGVSGAGPYTPGSGYSLNWMNTTGASHPTIEIVQGIQCTPASAPPGHVRILGGAQANLPTQDFTYYISDDPIDCGGDWEDEEEISFSLDDTPSIAAVRAANGTTFGTVWPDTVSLHFEAIP